ncbi:MAG: hypothetical protein J6S67_07665 [Methanobrevibacter sp.]|nr:hypothetical protein [Methanobrevibacter sp.]
MSTLTRYFSFNSGETLSITYEDDDASGAYVNTESNIAELQRSISNNIVQSVFRIYVLYPDETIAYEIPPENIKSGGSYSENYQNGQRRSLSFTLYNFDGEYMPNINQFWVGTRLRFEMGLKLLSGHTIWFQKGIFIITSAAPSETPGSREVTISASDKFCLFESGRGILGSTYTIPVNTDIYGLVRSIQFIDTGNGYPLDTQPVLFNRALVNKRTQVEITKSAGDSLGGLLLEVATQMSAEVFYNSVGQLVFAPINEVTADVDKPILYHYDTNNGDISQLDFNLDYNNVVNRVIVIGTSSTGGTFTHTAVNDDPASPLCYQRIGYHTGEVITDSNIYAKHLARERADYELRNQLIMKSTISATILCNPFLEVNNLISISDEFFDLRRAKFLIQSIGCSLDFSNQMQISATNIKNLPFLT